MRIVSLVPSLTELVWWLGAGPRLVGRTVYCTEPPEMAAAVPAFGGTKTPDIEGIATLRPDLVIANREENRREDVEALESRGLRVLVTNIESIEDATAVIADLGALLGAEDRAADLVGRIRECAAARPAAGRPRVFAAVWGKPLMGLGSSTFGHAMLTAAGAANVLEGVPRYPLVTFEALRAAEPELILLPDEPYRFRERHLPTFAAIAPTRLIDGKLLWWYGPRIPESIRTLRGVIDEARA